MSVEDVSRPLRILHLEDDVRDSELVEATLRDEGLLFELHRVQDKKGFLDAVNRTTYDLILSDFTLPDFDGFAALGEAQVRHPETPFIFVSGTIGEERAVESLIRGSTDYVLKEHLARLGAAIRRAVREAKERAQRIKTEEALRKSETRLTNLIDIAADAIISTDQDLIIGIFNKGAERIFGYSSSEAIGRSLNMLLPDRFVTSHQSHIRVFAQGKEYARLMGGRREVFGKRKDGSEFPAEASISKQTEHDKFVFTVILRDITERKQAETDRAEALERETIAREEAEAAKSQFRSLFEHSPGLFLVVEPEHFRIVAVSDAYLRATMTHRDSLVGKRLFDVFPDNPDEPSSDGVRNLRASLERVKRNKQIDAMALQRYPIRRPEGKGGGFEERFWSPVNSPVLDHRGNLNFIIHRVEDVTEFVRLKQKEGTWAEGHHRLETRLGRMEVDLVLRAQEVMNLNARLQASQQLLTIAGKLAKFGGWAVDLDSDRVEWSEEVCAIHDEPSGVTPTLAQALGYYPSEHRSSITEAFDRCLREGKAYDLELELVTAKGRRIWARALGEAVRNADGQIVRVQGAFQDISERKQAERKLAEQAALLDKARDAIIVRDLEGRIVFWNQSAERLYGWTAEQVMGKRKEFLYKDPSAFLAATALTLKNGEWIGEQEHLTKNGQKLIVECRWTLVRDETGKPRSILAINTDITERKKLEAQFFRTQRLESIGTLAGGIAHDLNNVLSPILMSIELLRGQNTDPSMESILSTLEISAQRGADLVKQVLSFAKGVEGKRVPLSLNHLLREIRKIVRDTFPKNIELRLNHAKDCWAVLGDPTQLQQVFLNLCVNARDAMPNGGTISIVAENAMIDEVYSGMNPEAQPGPFLRISVVDSGTGIPPEVRDRIFEPFFTTKEMGHGTGLGLSTTLTIIKSHGGFINVYSEAGKGSTFKVYLPASTSTEKAEEVAVQNTSLPRGNGELILIVDDEEVIRTIAQKTLERFGYQTLCARHGAEAVGIYASQKNKIAVVITDMAMPVMNGPAMILALKAINPAVKVIGSSGLDANGCVAEAMGAGVKHFIPKPYTAETLLKALFAILHPS